MPVKRAFYEQQNYRSARAGLSSRHAQVLKLAAKYRSGSQIGRVLDLGCLDGTFSMMLGRQLAADEVCGVDISQANVESAQAKGCRAIVFDLDSGRLPFDDASFDFIHVGDVLEHLYNPDFVIEQVSRIIKPKGSLFLSTPNILNLGSRIRFLFEGGFDFFREPILDYSKAFPSGLQNMHIIVWRYHELEYLLFKNGLCAENVYTDLMKPALKFWGGALLPLLKFQSWQKERRSGKKGGVDYRRINKIILSKELLFGRHLIIRANKFKLY